MFVGTSGLPPSLYPHDPSQMFKYSQDGKYEPIYPLNASGPNCQFNIVLGQKDVMTIRQAGLCHGAVLAQAEGLMFD
jgi:hypothetical protein